MAKAPFKRNRKISIGGQYKEYKEKEQITYWLHRRNGGGSEIENVVAHVSQLSRSEFRSELGFLGL
jgi:hypothetical protein